MYTLYGLWVAHTRPDILATRLPAPEHTHLPYGVTQARVRRTPTVRPTYTFTSTVSTFPGRVCDHRKLLERGFLLRTASIYHLNNIQVALDMCCARILRARALFCVLGTRLTVLDKFRAVTDTVVVSWCDDEASPRGAFGTTKSFPRSVFSESLLLRPASLTVVSIIYTGYPPRRSCYSTLTQKRTQSLLTNLIILFCT